MGSSDFATFRYKIMGGSGSKKGVTQSRKISEDNYPTVLPEALKYAKKNVTTLCVGQITEIFNLQWP